VKDRKPSSTGFRPASVVVRDLIRSATPRAERAPKRPDRAVELYCSRVLTVRSLAGSCVATVSITESDRIRLTVAARAFLAEGAKSKRKAEGDVSLPIDATDAGPVLAVQLDALPDGLAPGAVLTSIKVMFALDLLAQVPTIRALVGKLVLAEAEIVAAPVSLAPVSMIGLTDADVGLEEDPIAQEKAERYLLAALAYQSRRRAA